VKLGTAEERKIGMDLFFFLSYPLFLTSALPIFADWMRTDYQKASSEHSRIALSEAA
jgi:hypothetical protein